MHVCNRTGKSGSHEGWSPDERCAAVCVAGGCGAADNLPATERNGQSGLSPAVADGAPVTPD
jgi:hypothetical protein